MLLDSNIIIYSTQHTHAYLLDFFQRNSIRTSAISKIEVLGFHAIKDAERTLLEAFFNNIDVLPISDEIVEQAIVLRQTQRMRLGDAVVAATALCNQTTLVTRNVTDFQRIPGLSVLNPITP